MRVPEPGERALDAAAVTVRGVRIALLVGVRVVLAVVGDPCHHRALDRHRAERRERVLDRLERLERAVRQQPVEAERHAVAGSTYMIASTARSLQSTQVFHSSTIAATNARNGNTTAARLADLVRPRHGLSDTPKHARFLALLAPIARR